MKSYWLTAILLAASPAFLGNEACDDPSTSGVDTDGDGISEADGDCAPDDGDIYPGATELCDGIDNNCDAVVDEGCFAEACLDEYGYLADLEVPYTEPGTVLLNGLEFIGSWSELELSAGDELWLGPGAYPPGLHIDQALVTVTCDDAWITGSSSDSGIWISDDNVTVDGCNVVGVASGNSGGAGVKVSLSGAETLGVTLRNMIVAHNTVNNKHGGGVYANDASLELYDVVIGFNRVLTSGDKGAGLYVTGQDIESTVVMEGGALYFNGDATRGNGAALRGDGDERPQQLTLTEVCVGENLPHQLVSHGPNGLKWSVDLQGLMSLSCNSHATECTPTAL